MTWQEWLKWIDRQQKQKCPGSFVRIAERSGDARVFNESCKEREELDVKIKAYAANPKRWPPMTARERYFLHYRLVYAAQLVEQLAAPCDDSDPLKLVLLEAPAAFAPTLTWLLIVCWRRHGWHSLIAHWDLLTLGRRLPPPVSYPDDPEAGFAA